MPDDRHPREKRQLACCRCRSRKLAKCCTGECDRRRDPAGGGIVATQTLLDKSEILACLKGLSVVALVFLLVGLLFPAALTVGFSPGRIRWLRWSVLVHGSRRALRMLFLALCGRRLLRRLVLLRHGWCQSSGRVSVRVSAHSRGAERCSIEETNFWGDQCAFGSARPTAALLAPSFELTALCMLVQVARTAALTATLRWRALLARNIGSYGWRGRFVVFAPCSGHGGGRSGGVGGRILMTILRCLFKFRRLPP